MPEVQNPGLGAGQQAMLISTVNLTAAQIKTLHSAPVQAVSTPGVGKILVVVAVATVYKFNTTVFLPPTVAGAQLEFPSRPGGPLSGQLTATLNAGTDSFALLGAGFASGFNILPGADNQPLNFVSDIDFPNGAITATTLGAGGAGYAPNDTGTITTDSADATYKVLTVGGGGAVLTFQITGAGTSYAPGNGKATATGGAQPGVGTGLTINVTTVAVGDGTLKVVTYYQIIPVP